MSTGIPRELTEKLTPTDATRVDRWWRALAETERTTLAELWLPQMDDDRARSGDEVALALYGRTTAGTEPNASDTFPQDLFDYIVGHEEIRFHLGERSFHICRAHADARAVLRAGFLPAGFRCPLAEAACPMRRVLAAAGGESVVFTAGLRAED